MSLPSDLIDFLPCPTPEAWVRAALAQQDILLLDHRNCELKAAATAMSLIARYGQDAELSAALSKLAREELVHHEQVLRWLKRRGVALRPLTASRYASGLRAAVRTHEPAKLVDTLIVGAFIEARSCERFAALAPHLDEELATFYTGLLQSEGRHYQGYLRFAYRFGEPQDVERSIQKIRQVEQGLIESPDPEFRFHSGCPAG
ncbi:tRNA isopentenyl-2-thiomethyl-A-37 hydroxylase MiaE [uncultured Castellaniella sp.]|uniref:tRNA-(ms[2]io[6]A)-hydroxylase n=1 Tax=uncultured Castellaniella sp. TaxID=647907 RepID=UPI002608E007|nr:tRNA isopentenyl-2-thiomethyl-A-37 hydroxylase MiaE [uncultured Castellaniella sp.]